MSRRRVVVTGLGCITPVGNTVAEAWASLLAGKSGIAAITRFDASGLNCHFAGEVKNFDIDAYIPPKEARTMDTFIHYGIAAAVQAVQDAGLPTGDAQGEEESTRVGVLIGSGIGGLPLIESMHNEMLAKGPRRISPFFVPASIINMISGHVSMRFGFKGPNLAVATACTTGLHAIGEAGRHIEYGDADVMIAGGAEGCISPLGVGGFASMRALSTRNDDPTTASRPWDKDRDGFVLGEGAGVLVLEEYEHAKKRGAKIYAELGGYGMSADAHHITAPSPGGVGAIRCIELALEDAGLLVTLYMWDGDELIGYSCSFLSTHLHYSGLYYAHNDVLYLRPECRCAALGKQLIAATEKAVGDRGARMMTWHAKPNTALDKLLGGDFAYGVQDIMYTREL